jgi:signal transduction histidine kinase/DNA-binding response OmpR family regulator
LGNKLSIILLFLFVFSFQSIEAQEYITKVQYYGLNDGLSHRDVQCIHQDRQGVIWLGSRYGLNRFDGYRFEWLTSEKHGLQSNEVNHILEDEQGRMWLMKTGSFNDKSVESIDLFDPVTYEVRSFEDTFGPEPLFTAAEVMCFGQNEAGHLVFITNKNQLITYTDQFESYPVALGDYRTIRSINWTANQQFWVNLELGDEENALLILNKDGTIRARFSHSKSQHLYPYKFTTDGTGKYIDATNTSFADGSPLQFYAVDTSGQRSMDTTARKCFTENYLTNINPLALIQQHKDQYWAFNGDGQFWVLAEEDRQPTLMSQKYPALKWTTDILFDRDEAAWVSTQFGLYRFKLRKPLFRKLLFDRKVQGSNMPFTCRRMTVDQQGQLWVVIENQGGLWKVNPATDEAEQVVAIKETRHALGQDNAGHILFFQDSTMCFISPDSLRVEKEFRFKRPMRATDTWTIHEDKYGKIWYDNREDGELRYLDNGEETVLENWAPKNKNIFVYQFFEQASDTTWLVTNNGLFTIDIKTGLVLEHYWREGTANFYLPQDKLFHLHLNEDGTFWLATADAGLLHWHPQQGIIKQLTRADGLPNNTVYAIYEDTLNNLWLSTSNGIAVFNPATEQFRGYTEDDGLSHSEFNRVAHYQDEDGNIYFGSLNGITTFNPLDFFSDTTFYQPPVVITAFQQFDEKRDQLVDRTATLNQTKTITLNPENQFFRLEFALLAYDDLKNIQYGYRIDDLDKEWNYQQENTLRFSRLPYGKHILRIKGQTGDGLWSKNELVLTIKVLKPFYLQYWFLITIICSLFLGGYLYYRWRVKSLKDRQNVLEQIVAERTQQISKDKKVIEQQAEELKSLEQLKSRFFANVSHELRTPLTLMLGPIDSLLKRMNKGEEETKLLQFAQRNGQQLQKLINEILDLSKLEANKLEIKEEPTFFYAFLQDQVERFHSFIMNNQLSFNLDFQIDKSLCILLDKSKFEKIIQNYLSNALKFTPPGGQISIRVEEINGQLQISVKDTGNGIHQDDLPHIFDRFYQSKQSDGVSDGGTGIGLSLCRELAELLNGKVWAESELRKGSTFYFRFPQKIAPPTVQPEIPVAKKEVKISNGQLEKASATTDTCSSDKNRTNILIVEDNPDMRAYLQFLLTDYHVTTSENGEEALKWLAQNERSSNGKNGHFTSPDLIISDLMMPVMDGFEFLEQLKSIDRWRHLPVIMLTAKVNARAKLKALRIGVDDYLTKPFQEEELKTRVENLLHNYRERMNLFKQNEKNIDTKQADQPVIASVDAEWLEKVESIFSEQLSDGSLNLEFSANKVNLSLRQFRRRLKQLTGLSPNQYLKEMRLQRAKDLLSEGKFSTVKEVAFAVGFLDTRYFSDLFQRRFGTKPSALLKQSPGF